MSVYHVWDKSPGQDAALAENYDKVYRYCYNKLQQRELAEDITQEAFLRFLNHGNDLHSAHTLPYLYTIARNLCIDEYRKKKPLLMTESEQIEDDGAEEKMFNAVSLRLALTKLEEEERELLMLRYANEEPIYMICRIFGLSRFSVYRKLKTALKKLKECLEE
ncbi:MAG: RNA polymerase sigma factor [Bacillus sp. (in: Bacteria)]|nr:RNA polymerase sigma factor [Bacillus sp. (in: firmicutes)]MCM1427639.1 RNA polymerase sigma factor [Eubacterium sp.]